jgi:hypothetical protein
MKSHFHQQYQRTNSAFLMAVIKPLICPTAQGLFLIFRSTGIPTYGRSARQSSCTKPDF